MKRRLALLIALLGILATMNGIAAAEGPPPGPTPTSVTTTAQP